MVYGEDQDSTLDACGVLRVKGHVFTPCNDNVIPSLLAHDAPSFRYSVHLSAIKMYRDLR